MCGRGGIGRRARFRFWWATPVKVQVLSPAPSKRGSPKGCPASMLVSRGLHYLGSLCVYDFLYTRSTGSQGRRAKRALTRGNSFRPPHHLRFGLYALKSCRSEGFAVEIHLFAQDSPDMCFRESPPSKTTWRFFARKPLNAVPRHSETLPNAQKGEFLRKYPV